MNDPQNSEADPVAPQKGEQDLDKVVTERTAYFQSLSTYIQQARIYQHISSCFPFYMMNLQGVQANPQPINNNYQVAGHMWPFFIPNNPQANPAVTPQVGDTLTAADVIYRYGGFEHVIPPLYKRILAEGIDFILLFVLKLLVTFIAVDIFHVIDLGKFDLYKLTDSLDDFQTAYELTAEILILELAYRVFVCVFEAWCLWSSGATPGKVLLGIRVITARAVIPSRNSNTVLVYPGELPAFLVALIRSLFKNVLISLLFPLCFILFLFNFNRTGYDLMCNVIVVEENMYPRRRNVP